VVLKAVVFVEGERRDPKRPGAAFARRATAPVRPLFPLANRPFLFHILDSLEAAGITAAALVVGPDAEAGLSAAVEAGAGSGLALEWLELDDELGLADALRRAEPFLAGDPFLLHMGDSLGGEGLESLLADAAPGPRDAMLMLEPGAPPSSGSVVPLVENGVDDVGPAAMSALTGLAILGPEAPRAAGSLDRRMNLDHELMTTIGRLVSAGGRARKLVTERCWRFRNQPDPEVDANRFVLDGLGCASAGYTEAAQGKALIHESARVESTIVRGPAIIGPEAHLSHAYVGPYTSIGSGAVVEVAEVECSVILANATISHLERRLEDSVVGPGARVVHDFRIPRALRVNVGDGATIALS
jgi:glucose-1-phosphate thymidylyltransferase